MVTKKNLISFHIGVSTTYASLFFFSFLAVDIFQFIIAMVGIIVEFIIGMVLSNTPQSDDKDAFSMIIGYMPLLFSLVGSFMIEPISPYIVMINFSFVILIFLLFNMSTNPY